MDVLAVVGEDMMHEIIEYMSLDQLYFLRRQSSTLRKIINRHIQSACDVEIGIHLNQYKLRTRLRVEMIMQLTAKTSTRLNLCYSSFSEEEWISRSIHKHCLNLREVTIIHRAYSCDKTLQSRLILPRLQAVRKLTLVGFIGDDLVGRYIKPCGTNLEHLDLVDCKISGTCLDGSTGLKVLKDAIEKKK